MIIVDEQKITKQPLVTVQIYAYNKEAYIKECLDSVLLQETNFEYEVILSENPGSDHTRDICIEYQKKFPEKLILVLREENMGLFYNYFEAEKMSRGKYIARCDGDDYWCDLRKLQKQFDLMEHSPEVGLCYTQCRVYDENMKCFQKRNIGEEYHGFESMLLYYPVPQPTIFYRRDLFNDYLNEIKPQQRDWLMEDLPRSLWFAKNSQIKRIDDVTTVYRVVKDSMSHNINLEKQQRYYQSILDIRLFFYKLYCDNKPEILYKLYNAFYKNNIHAASLARKPKLCWKYYKQYRISGLKDLVRIHILLLKAFYKY